MNDQPIENTDRELYREPPGDYYAASVHVTEGGGLGIKVGGNVIVMSLRNWHRAGAREIGMTRRYTHPEPPPSLRQEIERAINRTSSERHSNTPDFILAEYLMDCLRAFELATNQRTQWFER